MARPRRHFSAASSKRSFILRPSSSFTGLAHKASQLFEPGLFDGDENAIVDFKYSTDPRLTWWFDHHQSAFLTPEDAEHFRRDTSGRKMYDPSFKSCTNYIATVARERFGFDAPDLAELVPGPTSSTARSTPTLRKRWICGLPPPS